MMRRFRLFFLAAALLFLSRAAVCETLTPEQMAGASAALPPGTDAPDAPANPDREAFIDAILGTAESVFDGAHGRPKRAQNSGDIYVCKNFTVYCFRQNAPRFRMAAFPDVPLIIPNNLPKADCAPYAYGLVWQDVAAEAGNPFFAAEAFRYDETKSAEENREAALALLRSVRRGDYFQMSAEYYYGTGAHSLIFIADYDPATDTVRWTDSNMKGYSKNGVRYAYVQYDAVRDVGWFADAFCRRKRGATLYRLRDDIVAY